MKKMFLILLTIILLFLGIIPICTANELDLGAEVNIEKTNTETPIISPYSFNLKITFLVTARNVSFDALSIPNV